MAGVSALFIGTLIVFLRAELAMGEDVKEEEAACYQLVSYQPSILPMFTQQTRNFQFAGKNWTIKQNWDEIGVASVIWEPVSSAGVLLLLT